MRIQARAEELAEYEFSSSNREVFQSFETTIKVNFQGVLRKEDYIDIIYPPIFELNPSLQAVYQDLDCVVMLESIRYTPKANSCRVSPRDRTISVANFLNIDVDSSQVARITVIIRSKILTNPTSERPVGATFGIMIKDREGNDLAVFDRHNHLSNSDYLYQARAAKLRGIKIRGLNEYTGQAGQFEVSLELEEGQRLASGFKMLIALPG